MKKSEIEDIVHTHIQSFEADHAWKQMAVDICNQKIDQEILSETSDIPAENTESRMLGLVDNINRFIETFAKEWEYVGQYNLLPMDALTNKENLSIASNRREAIPDELTVKHEMSKGEIVKRVQGHIRGFEAQHDWGDGMIRACIAGARIYVFDRMISPVPEENTKERMLDVSGRLNEVIADLVKDTKHEDQGAAFSVSDLYPKADEITKDGDQQNLSEASGALKK
jgi:hypothetical protein